MLVLFVPHDAIIIWDAVRTVYPIDNSFPNSPRDKSRCLEDTLVVRGSCGKRADAILKADIFVRAELQSVESLTLISRQMEKVKYNEGHKHLSEVSRVHFEASFQTESISVRRFEIGAVSVTPQLSLQLGTALCL